MTTAFYQRLIPRLFNAVCFGLVLIQTVTPVQSEEPVRLRILSWNIHHGEGVDGKLDLERIAAVIRGLKPDIVALQEVEVGSSRTNRVDQPAELARMTGLTSVFQQNIEFRGGGYGNALLSRLPVLSTNRLSLPNHDNGEQRGALSVQLRLPDRTDPLTFICTHLDHRSDDRERRDSAEAIERGLRSWFAGEGEMGAEDVAGVLSLLIYNSHLVDLGEAKCAVIESMVQMVEAVRAPGL